MPTVEVFESTITAALWLSPDTLSSVTRWPPISALGPTGVPVSVGVGDGLDVGMALGMGLGDGTGDGDGLIPTSGSLRLNGGGIFGAGFWDGFGEGWGAGWLMGGPSRPACRVPPPFAEWFRAIAPIPSSPTAATIA